MDVPQERLERIQESCAGVSKVLGELTTKSTRLIDVDAQVESGFSRIYMNYNRIGRYHNEKRKPVMLGKFIALVGVLSAQGVGDSGGRVSVDIKSIPSSPGGQYDTRTLLHWPEGVDNNEISTVVKGVMYDSARKLRYISKDGQRMVSAQVERESGVVLCANPLLGSSLRTLDTYDASANTFELRSRNIYEPEQQLVCLAGAIALAHVDDLLK